MAELTKKCKRLWTKPGIRWLCGYFFVLLCGVGLVYYWRVAYSLGAGMPGFAAATTLIICGGFSAVYLLVFLAAHFLKQNLALKTAVLVFLAGLCFVFANPPMQAPDETMHFLRAYAVGSGQFLFDEKQQFPNDVNLLVRDFPGRISTASAVKNWPRTTRPSRTPLHGTARTKLRGRLRRARSPRCSSWCRTSPRRWAWPWDGCSARTRWPVCIWRARRTCCAMPYCAVTRLRSSGAFRPC